MSVTSPKWIVHVATDAPDPGYGTGHCYLGMETGLARRGYRCTHVALARESRVALPAAVDEIELRWAKAPPTLPALGVASRSLRTLAFQMSSRRALQSLANGHRPDLVVCHGQDTLGAAGYAKRHGVPLVHFLFGSLADLLNTYAQERRTWGAEQFGFSRSSEAVTLNSLRWQARLEARIARQADHVVVPCRLRQQEVIRNFQLPAEKVTVVPMGVNAAAPAPVASPTQLRTQRGLPVEGLLCLTVGQCLWRKGILWLLAALVQIRDRVPAHTKFVLAGFHQRDRLERLIVAHGLTDWVISLGPQSPSQIRQLFGAADAFVLPSVEEGFGLVILEALAAGLPLVSTRVGGAPDLLTDDVNGLLVEPRDAVALGGALLRVLREPALRDRLRANGQKIAAQYSWDYTAQKLDAVYSAVLNGATR